MAAYRRFAAALRTVSALAVYWLLVFPQARRELRRWELRARAIPDPALQQLALDKLRDEGVCAEGVSAFAILAVTDRAAVVRFCVAFEVMYDLIDGLGEQTVANALANNRQLAHALLAALDPAAPLVDFYAFHPRRDDGGYLNDLIATCRTVIVTLPGFQLVTVALRRAAQRAGEAQSLNHVGTHVGDMAPLASWAATHWSPSELNWWETAAAAGAPLSIYVLCALATYGDVTERDVTDAEAAYFPWVAGLLGILESLVDRDEDLAAGTQSYAEHYASSGEVVTRAAAFARRSALSIQSLRQPSRHRVILAGMVATNLSHHGAGDATAHRAGAAVRADLDAPVGFLLALLRVRRWIKRLGAARPSGAG
jgi:tetraprenyl-beta-curcumene synthase